MHQTIQANVTTAMQQVDEMFTDCSMLLRGDSQLEMVRNAATLQDGKKFVQMAAKTSDVASSMIKIMERM